MKIAVLGTRGFPNVQGGVEAHCENLYTRLAGMGCEVTVLARKPYVGAASFEYKGVRIVPLSCPKNKFLEAFIHTLRGIFAARKLGPEIVHFHAVGPSLLVPIARLMGLKVVMTDHGPDYERKKWPAPAKFVLRLGEAMGSSYSNRIICISEPIAAHIKDKYHKDVAVIPNGVDIPKILSSDGSLKRYGLERNCYILAVGRFVPEKGFHILVEAFNIMTRDDPAKRRWKLVIAGRADHEDAYSCGLKESSAKNPDIVMTGYLSGTPLEELYSHAGLFVLPSYYEGMPLVLLEAMSYGLPCIASDIPANKTLELAAGRYFPAGDVGGLKKSLERFTSERFSEEARSGQIEMLRNKYSWELIARRTLEVYKRALMPRA